MQKDRFPLHINMSEKEMKRIDKAVEKGPFTNRSEWVRFVISQALTAIGIRP